MFRARFFPQAAAACALAFCPPAFAQNDEQPESPPLPERSQVESQAGPITVEVVARPFVHPWAVALLPDGRALVTERNPGRLRIVDSEGEISEPVAGAPDIFRFKGETGRSQAGLFDVVLHPDFENNRLVYLSYSAPTERGAAVTVSRGRLELDGGAPRLENLETVFQMREDDQDSSGLHFGGRMAVDAENDALFLTIGERRNISRSQDGEDQAGSILRMALDGAAPGDNPFTDDESKNEYIFAMGSRNSQAIALAPGDGALWSAEHGPLGGDRVDLVRPGANLGWPYISAAPDYSGAPIGVGLSHEGMRSPLHVFENAVAPSGAAFYSGEEFAEWEGDLLVGALAGEALIRIVVNGEEVESVEMIDIGRRIRDVEIAPDGAVWLVTEHEDGELLRLTSAR